MLSRLLNGEVMGAEIGVWRGSMSVVLLARPDLFLYMVDNWEEVPEYAHKGYGKEEQKKNMEKAIMGTEFASGRRKVFALSSTEAARHVDNGSLDFVFIDADHSYSGVSSDISAWLPKLRSNGLLCGHDYNNSNIHAGVEVKRAVDDAVMEHGWNLEIGSDSTWFVRLQ